MLKGKHGDLGMLTPIFTPLSLPYPFPPVISRLYVYSCTYPWPPHNPRGLDQHESVQCIWLICIFPSFRVINLLVPILHFLSRFFPWHFTFYPSTLLLSPLYGKGVDPTEGFLQSTANQSVYIPNSESLKQK